MQPKNKNLYHLYRNEEEMTIAFIKQVDELISINMLDKYDVIHIPNGQKAGGSKIARIIAGGKDKKMGAMAGTFDYLLRINPLQPCWLEAKRYYVDKYGECKKTYLSSKQKEFKKDAESRGERCFVFRSPEEGIDILLSLKNEVKAKKTIDRNAVILYDYLQKKIFKTKGVK